MEKDTKRTDWWPELHYQREQRQAGSASLLPERL
jgi:hypothetical protein